MRSILIACLFSCPLLAQEAPEPPEPPRPPRMHAEGTPHMRVMKMMHGEQTSGPVTWLGVVAREVSPEASQQLDLPAGSGLVVEMVVPDSGAAKAGVQKYDILTKLDDQMLVNPPQLVTLVRSKKEGDKVELTLLRKGKLQKVTATLGTHVMPAMDDDDDDEPGMPPEHFFRGDGTPAPKAGKTVEQSKMIFKDGDLTITATSHDNDRHVTIFKGKKKVFDGPYNTDADKAKAPADLRKRVDELFERQPPKLETPGPDSKS